jgi:hypothetical protein
MPPTTATAFEGLTYNSRRTDIAIPEYGRVVHELIAHCLTIEDREERTRCATAIVSVMRTLVPGSKEMVDHEEKLWGHLHVMANWELDIEGPFPPPARPEEDPGPERLTYTQMSKRPSFYGRLAEELIEKAKAMPEGEERNALSMMIANLLKRQYLTWNKGAVEDPLIRAQLREMSGGALDVPAEIDLMSSSEILKSKRKTSNNFRSRGGGKRKR